MNPVPTIVRYGLQEALRRKMFAVVSLLTVAFLVLYWLGTRELFTHLDDGIDPDELVDTRTLVGATVLGLAMFATLFLGAVLAVFLTLGVVRGDAERGLLQPLVVRPVGRSVLLLARFLGASAVCAGYVVAVFGIAVVITGVTGDWWPDRLVVPALELAGAVVVIVGLSLLGSVFLSATANGIAVFMLFGAGLVAGLLGQIGEALNSGRLERIATVASWILPFEGLYQDGLSELTADTTGFTEFALSLGPFGGAQEGGAALRLWAVAYMVALGAVALAAFARKDL
ncbi:MAG: ABC transporter permease [Actinomycetota bacterium]|nr:ABC transporter permease [Actinomycetota bacterium]